MLKYRIFFFGYGGHLYDAFGTEVITEDCYFNTAKDAAEGLALMHGLRTDLTFVILPVYVPEEIKKMDTDNFVITEYQIIEQMQEWLTSCDYDMLAHFVGEIFGGTCEYVSPQKFIFTPNDDYMGAFDKQ